jgi:protein-L-isoaspartate(D-aspartate) O-methyltransferase
MLFSHLPRGGVRDPRVIAAMGRVPREAFVLESLARRAYEDRPLPIGHGQTISQPACVGYMVQLLQLDADDEVLEIGTGCGYQTAILRELADHVRSIERVEPLYEMARANLSELGYDDIELRLGDGFAGWGDEARFDAIVLSAAPEVIPSALVRELKPGGRLVAPVGRGFQELVRLRRAPEGLVRENHGGVRFVPMLDGVSRAQK